MDSQGVFQSKIRDALTKLDTVTVDSVTVYQPLRNLGTHHCFDLLQGNLWLCEKSYFFGNFDLLATLHVMGPTRGEIKLISQRQARFLRGERERDCHLAVLRVADLPTVLPLHTDRSSSLFWKARLINNPGQLRRLQVQPGENILTNGIQNLFVAPRSIRNKMMK